MLSLEKQLCTMKSEMVKLQEENRNLKAGRKVSESNSGGRHNLRLELVEGFADMGLTKEEAEIAAGRKISKTAISENKSEEKESPLVESFMRGGLTKEEARLAASPRSCRSLILARV